MQLQQSYNDLCEEISGLQEIAKDIEYQLKLAYKQCYDGKMPADSWSRMPLDKALENYDSVVERLNNLNEVIAHKEMTKQMITERLGKLNNLESQVMFRRTVMRQTLNQIADELGYAEGYIKHVSRRANITFMSPRPLQDRDIL
jgi:DNA-directed RNA polymerase specialized sigma subunit